MASPHLLLALSGHGYGHLAQCTPVINALREDCPDLRLSVCGKLPQSVVAERLDHPFDYHCVELDPVLQMFSAWEVDVPASRLVYRAFHDRWDTGLQQDKEMLQQINPDLLLADIPYRVLTAAAQLDITAIGLCSINWAAIYAAYCTDDSRDRKIIAQMISSYQEVHTFLTPQPAIPMPQLGNTCSIGPIARTGNRQRGTLCLQTGISRDAKIVLVALGGIPSEIPLENWPYIDGTVWLFANKVDLVRSDFLEVSALDLSFIDILASADVVLTKPGYGTYTEAVCNGVPVLTLERPDWPETAVLNHWVRQYGALDVISCEQFSQGTFAPHVRSLLAAGTGASVEPAGIRQAVEQILSLVE